MNILIIGATSGIGYKLWQHYSAHENNVTIIGRRKTALDEIKHQSSENTTCVQCDIGDINSFNNAFDRIVKHLKNIDLIILCAGVGELNPDLNIMTELSTIDINVSGWTNCVNAAYNHFLSRNHGHLVTITSIGGLLPSPAAPSYSASKAFQINYTKALQAKSKKSDILITEIRPGLVDTRMAKGDGLFWIMPLDKVAKRIIKAIEKKHTRAIVTYRWRFINFLLKHFF